MPSLQSEGHRSRLPSPPKSVPGAETAATTPTKMPQQPDLAPELAEAPGVWTQVLSQVKVWRFFKPRGSGVQESGKCGFQLPDTHVWHSLQGGLGLPPSAVHVTHSQHTDASLSSLCLCSGSFVSLECVSYPSLCTSPSRSSTHVILLCHVYPDIISSWLPLEVTLCFKMCLITIFLYLSSIR